jgi:outer membrane protein OmpU
MTNLKKIGLTALAGTLAATTFAQAVEVSVNGTARMEYESRTSDAPVDRDAKDSTNEMSNNQSVTFSASGELDNGFVISYSNLLTGGGALTSAFTTMDMGDMGTISMDNHAHKAGISSIQDKVPNAGEQAWDESGGAHGTVAQGVADLGSEETLGYKVSMSGVTFSASHAFATTGTEQSVTLVADGLVDGLAIGAGTGNNTNITTDDDVETYFITYAAGPITVGAQQTNVDAETANTDVERQGLGISFAVNENLSISYGTSETEWDAAAQVDEKDVGISASYTAGGMTVGVVHNKADDRNGSAGADFEVTEIKLTFAF